MCSCLLPQLLRFITTTTLLIQVQGYYCNHDLCSDGQYCCGDNLCCDYVYSLWYFWVGVIFLVLLISVCGGLFRYCCDSSSNKPVTSYIHKISHLRRYFGKNQSIDKERMAFIPEDVESASCANTYMSTRFQVHLDDSPENTEPVTPKLIDSLPRSQYR